MNFYTNVTRYGNSLLYIGYKGGQRVKQRIPFKPKLYVTTSKPSTPGRVGILHRERQLVPHDYAERD